MKHQKYIILLYSLIFLLGSTIPLKCGEEEIENCKECGKGDKLSKCIKCIDKYFPFFNNLICLPCDDPIYGQFGCVNCTEKNNALICDKNGCKGGFYNRNGTCYHCSEKITFCKRCSFTLDENNEENLYCQECDEGFYVDNNGLCKSIYCGDNCKKCHANSTIENDVEIICDKCREGLYVDKENPSDCKACKGIKKINNGFCSICSDDETNNKTWPWWCNKYYTKGRNSECVKCPENCPYCRINPQSENIECLSCDPGYTINIKKTCTYCGAGCEKCTLSSDNETPVCSLCFSRKFSRGNKCLTCIDNCKSCENELYCKECNPGYTLSNYQQCVKCPEHCSLCNVKTNGEVICSKCFEQYALKSEKECVYCKGLKEVGMQGCEKCGYNKKNQQYECYSYNYEIDSYENYMHVINTYQRFNNTNKKSSYYGCLLAYKNNTKYECITCKYYDFVENTKISMVEKDKKCIAPNDYNLGWKCLLVENKGSEFNPKYSCIDCNGETKVKNGEQTVCMGDTDKLLNCLESKTSGNDYICTKCYSGSHLNSYNKCVCNNGYFLSSDNLCVKCDIITGCNPQKGCNYYSSTYKLICNQCKPGYYKNEDGLCDLCSKKEHNYCEKCHYDFSVRQIICDKCLDGYSYDPERNLCELKNCVKHSEISEGCIICDSMRDEFISNKKCHICEKGYFKTKEGKCVYCKSEKYGGPACNECGYTFDENYEETNNIVCLDTYTINEYLMSPDGKLFKCSNYISHCDLCKYDNGKIECLLCMPGYYLNTNGLCINYLKYLEKIPNCAEYTYQINYITFCHNIYSVETYYCTLDDSGRKYKYAYFSDYEDYLTYINYKMPVIDSSLNAKCILCDSEYYLNYEGKCVKMIDDDCSIISILENYPERYDACENYCINKLYIQFDYKNNQGKMETFDIYDYFIENVTFNHYSYYLKFNYNNYSIGKIIYDFMDDNIKPLFIKSKLCVSVDKNLNSFEGCERVKYDEKTKSYKCNKCSYYYILDRNENICKYIGDNDYYNDHNCIMENIGTETNPIYSCTKCIYDDEFLLVKTENDLKYCISKYYLNDEIKYCTEAYADITYPNIIYQCTKCSLNFLPFYSKFFERKICQSLTSEIIKEKDISLEKYEGVEYIDVNSEGICEKNYFTPDGKRCYKCNNKDVGIPGCKGACSFTLKRNESLQCEDGCESGYLEIRKGICESCEKLVIGCSECHYDKENRDDYYVEIGGNKGIICDLCKSGEKKSKCINCEDLNLEYCDECEYDPNDNSNYICTKCNDDSFLMSFFNYCQLCGETAIKKDSICYNCDENEIGGIEGCEFCENNDKGDFICQLCKKGYILLSNNNTCLNRSKVEKQINFKNFKSCEKLTLDENNEFYCSRCDRIEYFLLKEKNNDKGVCFEKQKAYKNDEDYYEDYPCQEAINIGSSGKPKYSCTKCYQTLEYRKSYMEESQFVKIIDKNTQREFCMYSDYINIKNCSEAIVISLIKNIYKCDKCIKDNQLMYDSNKDTTYCLYADNNIKCMVQDCKICKNGDNYFCKECALSNYQVNRITGQCVKKTDNIPAITWKDIFNLEINGQHERNGLIYKGPSLTLRGITTYEIYAKHGFCVYLLFRVKNSGKRYLEEDIKIKAICETMNITEEFFDELYIIDYKCLANDTQGKDLTNYKLEGIEEGDNEGFLKNSNLNNLMEGKTMEEVIKLQPIFTIEDLKKYAIFKLNEIQDQKANNYIFDFKLEGELNKDINKQNISINLQLNEIEETANCIFMIEDNKKANLICRLDINKYKNKNLFSFKTYEINTENNENIYFAKLDQILLYNDVYEEEEKKNKSYIIIGCIIGGIILISIGICIIIYLVKRPKNINTINQNNEINNRQKNERRVNPYINYPVSAEYVFY